MSSLPDNTFQLILHTYPFQSSLIVRISSEATIKFKYALKLRHFHWKIKKIAQRCGLCPQTLASALFHYKFLTAHLIITAAFTWDKEKDGNIIKLSQKVLLL